MGVIVQMNEDHTAEVLAEFKAKKKQALEAIGLQAEGYAQYNAPFDTGRLRNSISHKIADEDGVAIGTNVEYAPYQEFGTSKMKEAHPFLKPAVVEHLDEYKALADSIMRS